MAMERQNNRLGREIIRKSLGKITIREAMWQNKAWELLANKISKEGMSKKNFKGLSKRFLK
jgi:hypothetical protein